MDKQIIQIEDQLNENSLLMDMAVICEDDMLVGELLQHNKELSIELLDLQAIAFYGE